VPIGRPISNTHLQVCDSRGEPVPIGVTGELRIGGYGVASGYVGEAMVTSDRFLTTGKDERMYCSGDQVRYRTDGVLEYLGRIDNQLKLRGHRIEPAEIEMALRLHPAIDDAIVVIHQAASGDDRLVAALRLTEGITYDEVALRDTLRSHLQGLLPAVMVPGAYRCLTQFPLTASGKADRAQIASLVAGAVPTREHVPPVTALEQVIVHSFIDALKTDQVSALDDFFADLGGHSLLATRLVSQLRELLHIDIPLRLVFEARSPRELARALATSDVGRQRLEAIAEIVLQVQGMSDEQVQARLQASRDN
jgi:pipecolate-incorporating enzyme